MSFVYKNFGVLAGSTNANGALMDWSYISDTDNVATIIASDYFLELCENLENPLIAVGQKIWIKASDGYVFVYFDTVTTSSVSVTKLPQDGAVIKNSYIYTTVGGNANETVTLEGVLSTDLVIATINTPGTVPVTITKAFAGTGNYVIGFSGDPADDTVVNVMIVSPF
jgi:hypothetical protein